MSNSATTTFDKNRYQELKHAYESALADKKEDFIFYEQVLLTSYA